ncbi:MAG: hypothetical protein ACTHWF_12750 [Brachybacterium sp.]
MAPTKGTMMSASFSSLPSSRPGVSRRNVLAGMSAAGAALGLAACGGSSGAAGGVPDSDESHKDFVMTVWGGEEDKRLFAVRGE